MAEVGSCAAMADEAFGGRLLCVIVASFAVAAGMVLGWLREGCCARLATTAITVVAVQASPAPTLVGAMKADEPTAGAARRS